MSECLSPETEGHKVTGPEPVSGHFRPTPTVPGGTCCPSRAPHADGATLALSLW